MKMSIREFCKGTSLSPTTVHRRCVALGIDTSTGLSPDAVEQLRQHFGLKPAVNAVPEGFIQSSSLVPVQVVETELPEGFDPTAMVKFFDGVAGQGTNTSQLLNVAKQVLTAVEVVMDKKIQAQREELNQAEQDGSELQELIAETKTSLQIKALEARILAERQTVATTQAQKAFTELMELGKPQ